MQMTMRALQVTLAMFSLALPLAIAEHGHGLTSFDVGADGLPSTTWGRTLQQGEAVREPEYECMDTDTFTAYCVANLTSDIVKEDGVSAQVEFTDLLFNLPCLFTTEECGVDDIQPLDFFSRPVYIELQLKFIDRVCDHHSETQEEKENCEVDLLLNARKNNLTQKLIFGFFTDRDEFEQQMTPFCRSIYPDLAARGILIPCSPYITRGQFDKGEGEKRLIEGDDGQGNNDNVNGLQGDGGGEVSTEVFALAMVFAGVLGFCCAACCLFLRRRRKEEEDEEQPLPDSDVDVESTKNVPEGMIEKSHSITSEGGALPGSARENDRYKPGQTFDEALSCSMDQSLQNPSSSMDTPRGEKSSNFFGGESPECKEEEELSGVSVCKGTFEEPFAAFEEVP